MFTVENANQSFDSKKIYLNILYSHNDLHKLFICIFIIFIVFICIFIIYYIANILYCNIVNINHESIYNKRFIYLIIKNIF